MFSTIRTIPRSRSAFTLVEIMVVVVIIGILAALGVPSYKRVRTNANANIIASNFRVFANTFVRYAMEEGEWPEDGNANDLSETADPYFARTAWSKTASNGGYWDWELNRHGVIAAVGLTEGTGQMDEAVFVKVDEILDDGNLSTGDFIQTSGYYIYILQQD
jgi:prepilin-type N-terminal cleavage/methylation domain-containing protein